MSCIDCELIQKLNTRGKKLAYYRFSNANVLIGACDKHFNQMFGKSENQTVYRVDNNEG